MFFVPSTPYHITLKHGGNIRNYSNFTLRTNHALRLIDFSSQQESKWPSPLTPGNPVTYESGEYVMTLVDHPGDPSLFSGKLLVLVDQLPKIIGISWRSIQFMASQASPHSELRVELVPLELSVVTAGNKHQKPSQANTDPLEDSEIAASG